MLHVSKVSRKCLKAFEDGIKFFPESDQGQFIHSAEPDPEKMPHPIYVLNPEDIVSGDGFANARLIGWRQLVDGHALEVYVNEQGEETFAGMNQGKHMDDMIHKLRVMKHHTRVKHSDFDVAVITIPALYTMALWLRARKPEEDLIIPVGPTHPKLSNDPRTIFTPGEFLELLKEDAAKRINFAPVP
ncbi:MAG: hypothetical protein ACM3SY_15510 [Candidatus Omnitrophota bacterium]